ncbi:hypothetical protein [Amycolatopsis sp. PS_44_ISF1]|uniref:hypothetical protein n=1 Tax=Amycolatopsis sp. PS_44_ISF1 TaxID=2974917 RepID=UPI0028DF8AE0|nr:hypothetical protein [Amycolatopsis sp. PS_44_ISF1]MDT8915972.1 hypothetical protein [Amycolatopsis sp. PS_44_ISF1]
MRRLARGLAGREGEPDRRPLHQDELGRRVEPSLAKVPAGDPDPLGRRPGRRGQSPTARPGPAAAIGPGRYSMSE